MMKPAFAIIGCGKVGTALSIYLTKSGYSVAGLSCLTLSSAQALGAQVAATRFTTSPEEITIHSDVVFITTPDDRIEQVCNAISSAHGFKAGSVILHCSGALPSTILASAKSSGAFIGSMHPLQSFASTVFEKNPFSGIITDIEGDDTAVKIAQEIAADLGAKSLIIKTEAKTLFHAAAVVASNYLVTVMDLALQFMGKAGVERKDAWNVLKPLVEGTVSNIGRVGIPEALTGPISRGDIATVERHNQAIKDILPELLSLYKVLGRHTVELAVAKGTLMDEASKAFIHILTPEF